MANIDRPHGAIPLYRMGGGNISVSYYDLGASNAIIGIGDFMERETTGVIDRAEATDKQIVGVSAESAGASSGGGIDSALSDQIAVYASPDIIYVMQGDGVTDTIAAADLGLNIDFVVANAVNGISQMELDSDSEADTATLPLNLIRLYRHPNNAFGANGRFEVKLNNSVYNGEQLGI